MKKPPVGTLPETRISRRHEINRETEVNDSKHSFFLGYKEAGLLKSKSNLILTQPTQGHFYYMTDQ